MAGLAQSVEHQIVALRAMGSSPIARPNPQKIKTINPLRVDGLFLCKDLFNNHCLNY